MFAEAYQKGPFVEVLTAAGHSAIDQLTANWRRTQPSALRRVYDATAKTYVFSLNGSPSTSCRITAPSDSRLILGLRQPYLVLQIRVNSDSDFSFETTIADKSGSRRTLKFSTFFRKTEVGPLNARISLANLRRMQWINAVVPLKEMVSELWSGQEYESIHTITLCANCSFRRIFTLRNIAINGLSAQSSADSSDTAPAKTAATTIPKAVRMSPSVSEATQILSWTDQEPPQTNGFQAHQLTHEKITGDYGRLRRPSELPRSIESHSSFRRRMNVSSAPPKTPMGDRRSRLEELNNRAHNAKKRSSSLPRLQTRQSLVHDENDPMPPLRHAWRGPSALHRPQRGRRPIASRGRSKSSNDIDAVVLNRILAERVTAVIAGPDEELVSLAEDSDSDEEPMRTVVTNVPAPSSSDLSAPSPLPTVDLDTFIPIKTPATSQTTPAAKSALWPSVSLDFDERAMLLSMRRANMSTDSTKNTSAAGRTDSKVSDLSRHEYNDSSDDEFGSEDADGLGPMTAPKARSPALHQLGVIDLKSSLSQSMLSSRLRHEDNAPITNGASASTPSDDTIAPVLDLIFDPELNCYYNPRTRQYYQVTPASR
uniref:CFA20 domain-containing protein n=1 Tax=Plectus sambesii TaxID=2011161 RepID=A0A914W9Z1_9BILA